MYTGIPSSSSPQSRHRRRRKKRRGRGPHYLLRTMEEVYDAAADYFKDTREEKVLRILNKVQEKKAATLTEFLSVGGVDLQRELKMDLDGSGSSSKKKKKQKQEAHHHQLVKDFVKPWIFLPNFFASFLRREYGPQEAFHQVLLDFLTELELHRSTLLQAQIFSDFLRQLLDETALAFFLHARDLIQTELGLSLKNLKSPALGVHVTGVVRLPGLIMLSKHYHPSLGLADKRRRGGGGAAAAASVAPAGMMIPHLTERSARGIAALLMRGGAGGGGKEEEKGNDAVHIAQHFVELLARRGLLCEFPPGTDLVLPTNTDPLKAVSVIHFLSSALEDFVKAPDDIVARVKYDDDGTGLSVLQRLQKSLEMDKDIKETQDTLTVMEKELSDQRIEILKFQKKQLVLEREMSLGAKTEVILELGQIKTKLLMSQQEAQKRQTEVEDLSLRLKSLMEEQNQIWTDIMSRTSRLNSSSRHSKTLLLDPDAPLPPNPNFFRAARIFELTLRRSMSAHVTEAKVQQKFDRCDWREELFKLHTRCATSIQRWYRRVLKAKYDMLRLRQERERLEKLEREALEAERQQQLLLQRHRLAEESIVLSKLADMKCQKANYARSVREHEKKLKLQISYGIIEKMREAKYKEFKRQTLKEWRINAKEVKLERITCSRIKAETFNLWYEGAVKSLAEYRAACCIQRHWRGFVDRRWTREPLARINRNNITVRQHLLLQRHRFSCKLLHAWRHYATVSRTVTQRFNGYQARLARKYMNNWLSFSKKYKKLVDHSARVIQGMVRMYQARQALETLKEQRDAAIIIQKTARGKLGRKRMLQERDLVARAELAKAMGDRVYRRGAMAIWHVALAIVRMGKRNQQRRQHKILSIAIEAWKKIAAGAGSRRMALLKKKEAAATSVQKTFRGYWTRKQTHVLFVAWRAAIMIQSTWRGHCCRVQYKIVRHEHYSCVTIQKVWRGHRTRQGLHGFKIQDALLAAKANDYKRLTNYFQKHPMLTDEADEEGNNVLHYSAMGGAKRTAKLCLKKGLDPNMYNCGGQTALHLAISSCNSTRDELTTYLVDHGAWIEVPDLEGRTPLLLAAQLGRAVIVRELLERDADISARDINGYFALHLATYNGYYGAAKELIASGNMEIDEKTADGSTALHIAVSTQNADITELLLDNGAFIEVADTNGRTALHIAADLGDEKLALMLLDRGANIEARDHQGRTPYFVAGMAGHNKMLALLSQSNADIDATDTAGDTTLHAVARDGSFKTLQMLLSMGANPNIRNNDGDLPTHIAAAKGDQAVMEELTVFGGSIRKRNWANLTPVGVARMSAQKPMIDYLSQIFMLKAKAEREEEEDEATAERQDALLIAGERTLALPASSSSSSSDQQQHQMVAWQEDFEAIQQQWNRVWDDASRSYYYINQVTGESSWEPPRTNALALIAKRDELLADAPIIKAVAQPPTAAELENWKKTYLDARDIHDETLEQQLVFDQAATIITMAAHRFLSKTRLSRLRIHRNAARKIQRAVRHWASIRHTILFGIQTEAAVKIQAAYRGHYTRVYWVNQLRPYFEKERTARWLAQRLTVLFRGYMARKKYRLMLAELKGPQNLQDWMMMLQKAGAPLRTGCDETYAEYQVPVGYEQEDGKVTKFYHDRVKNAFAWDQPMEWIAKEIQDAKDLERALAMQEYTRQVQAARKIAMQYRQSRNRIYLGHIIKARQMVTNCEVRYLANQSHFPNLMNYTLYNHIITMDYSRAAVLYEKGYRLMKERGPDVHVFLLSYAVFLAASQKGKWDTILGYAERGRKAVGKAILLDKKKIHPFNLAMIGFFRQATITKPSNSSAWLNLALCYQLVWDDITAAHKAYIKALSCLDLNPLVIDNYKYFLREYKDTDIIFDEAYRSVTARQEAKVIAEAEAPHLIIMDEAQEEEFNKAATRLQSAWRSYNIRKKIASGSRWWEEERTKQEAAAKVAATTTPPRSPPLTEAVPSPRWQAYQDEGGNVYYYDEVSGQFQWEKPEKNLMTTMESANDVEPAMSSSLLWQSAYDETSGNVYYYNTITGETSWELPTEEEGGEFEGASTDDATYSTTAAQQDNASDGTYAYDTSSSSSSSMWQTYMDENSGMPYYYNTMTGETRWDLPATNGDANVAPSQGYKGEEEVSSYQEGGVSYEEEQEAGGGGGGNEKEDDAVPTTQPEQLETSQYYYDDATVTPGVEEVDGMYAVADDDDHDDDAEIAAATAAGGGGGGGTEDDYYYQSTVANVDELVEEERESAMRKGKEGGEGGGNDDFTIPWNENGDVVAAAYDGNNDGVTYEGYDDAVVSGIESNQGVEETAATEENQEQQQEEQQPLPEGWSWTYDDEGRVYYYNITTAESSWDPPSS